MDLQRTLTTFGGTPLTLRDMFAAACANGTIVAIQAREDYLPDPSSLVAYSDDLADAMLAEREKERP